ncbi:hypothetical protein NM208_g8269 [Fusarium decemcellulare]|uniref:Uncharacterized protein n=1 Tax=Fusarium decemcellulare TaxID=57161 RepID=A0ACC1S5Y0_9HYPO|nr:hypothetical protein NM208_g8269 [Fusarium decemcellulare]
MDHREHSGRWTPADSTKWYQPCSPHGLLVHDPAADGKQPTRPRSQHSSRRDLPNPVTRTPRIHAPQIKRLNVEKLPQLRGFNVRRAAIRNDGALAMEVQGTRRTGVEEASRTIVGESKCSRLVVPQLSFLGSLVGGFTKKSIALIEDLMGLCDQVGQQSTVSLNSEVFQQKRSSEMPGLDFASPVHAARNAA